MIMDAWTVMVVSKVARFLIGLAITVGFGFLGIQHGRRIRKAMASGSCSSEPIRFTPRILIRDLAIAGFLVFLICAAERAFLLVSRLSGYLNQFGFVALRSVLVFFAALQWKTSDYRKPLYRVVWILGPAIAIMTAIEIFILWPASTTLGKEEYDPRSGIVMQSTAYSCAPAALATICRLYGRPVTEREAAVGMGTGLAGTADSEIAFGAETLGFGDAKPWRPTLEEIASYDRPIILSVRYFDLRELHAVSLLGISTDSILIGDPLIGLRTFRRDTFHEEWGGNAVFLGTPSFPFSSQPTLSNFRVERLKSLLPSWKPRSGS